MDSIINRVLFFLWPPYEAWHVERELHKKHKETDDETRWQSILVEIRASMPTDNRRDEIEVMAKEIQDSEDKRKETIENKASSFVSGIGIALSIVSLAAALLIDKQMPKVLTIPLACTYLFAIIHLFAATYCAVKARRVAAFAAFSAGELIGAMKIGQLAAEDRLALSIGRAKWNEELLLRKSNWLSASESLFVHGLFLASISVVMSVTIKLVTTWLGNPFQ